MNDSLGACPAGTGLSGCAPSPAVSAVPASIPSAVWFKFIEFNPRRAQRGAAAARVEVGDETGSEWLWMSPQDLRRNIQWHGNNPELLKARDAYAKPHARGIEVRSTTTVGRGPKGAEPGGEATRPKD